MISLKSAPWVPKAGVFAIRQAPILANNLRVLVEGKGDLQSYQPQKKYLQIINLGKKKAIFHYGKWSWSGRLAWRVKDWINRDYMKAL